MDSNRAILRQDIAWFDTQSAGTLINRLSQNIANIEVGIDSKLGEFVQNISGFITGMIVSFSVGWKLSLVAVSTLPLTVISFTLFGVFMKVFLKKELQAYAHAGATSGQALASIRTVVSFGGEEKELQRYTNELGTAEAAGIRKSLALGGGLRDTILIHKKSTHKWSVKGMIGFVIFNSAALIFWYGTQLIMDGGYTGGTVVAVFINIVIGSISLGNALPDFRYFANAQASARDVFGIIERVPPIDKDAQGIKLPEFHGNIKFKNVTFIYPSRPDIKILENFSLDIHSGQTVALVGPSGSGKSTIVHMLQRLYDPVEGQVLIENTDIRKLDLTDLRNRMGCVQQEPILFEGTVEENIRLGKLNASFDEIEEAAKLANAHDFIKRLPAGYQTYLTVKGTSMSGGQKQRLAIARALIRHPKLLLLDEATSALDTTSERIVQAALNRATHGRTVVVVAHRLSTIRNADVIVVLDKGKIVESGTHEELMDKNGLYAFMVNSQSHSTEEPQSDIVRQSLDSNTIESSDEDNLQLDLMNDVESLDDVPTTAPTSHLSILSLASSITTKSVRVNYVWRMLKLNKPEVWYIVAGCICSFLVGASQPTFAILYSEVFEIFTLANDPSLMISRIQLVSGLISILGIVRFFSNLAQGYFFGVSGERLIKRIRTLVFHNMLKQEMAWFDKPENQAGILTGKLAVDASKVANIAGIELGVMIESVALVLIAIVIAFAYSWQLTLVVLLFFPLIALSGIFQMRSKSPDADSQEDVDVFHIAQEAFLANRTVTVYNLENYFYENFSKRQNEYRKSHWKTSVIFAAVYSISQGVPMFYYAAVFSYGAKLLTENKIQILGVFRVFAAIGMSAPALGRTASTGLDIQLAISAAKRIFVILDRKSKIPADVGYVPDTTFSGLIGFRHINFRYPTRPQLQVLNDFSHSVKPGQTVALVGESGCGKSTLLQLVQRFYNWDNSPGENHYGIFFDNMNLRDLAPNWVRKQIGIVSQEPNLFNMTLRDNIAYGANFRDVGTDEIVLAARAANAHDFISTLPQGYDTMVGEGGCLLSGGQKQRIAIARAMLRNPPLLLLDEATSALDTESERLVQQAIDSAIGSRTCLVIAHRLSTVKNADLIVVLQDGREIESGSPAELMESRGVFYAMSTIND